MHRTVKACGMEIEHPLNYTDLTIFFPPDASSACMQDGHVGSICYCGVTHLYCNLESDTYSTSVLAVPR